MPDGQKPANNVPFALPRVLAWEVTRQCPLKCRHCRAGAANVRYADELSTAECLRVIEALPPLMVIWTGGEPMLRPDIIENEVFNKRPEQLSVQEFIDLTNLIGNK